MGEGGRPGLVLRRILYMLRVPLSWARGALSYTAGCICTQIHKCTSTSPIYVHVHSIKALTCCIEDFAVLCTTPTSTYSRIWALKLDTALALPIGIVLRFLSFFLIWAPALLPFWWHRTLLTWDVHAHTCNHSKGRVDCFISFNAINRFR